MSLRDRIGIDIGRKLPLEDAVSWAAAHEVRFIDVQLDTGANALGTIDGRRGAALRRGCERHGVHLGLHTSSAVNVAEYAPYVGDAVEEYLRAYVDAAVHLGAGWIVMHAGFHFTSDRDQRIAAGRERLQRIVSYAEERHALVLLENLNKEPAAAEVHYLAHTVEEWRLYVDAIQSPAFRLSFTVNHAHLVPEGVAGFIDAHRDGPGRGSAARRLLAQRVRGASEARRRRPRLWRHVPAYRGRGLPRSLHERVRLARRHARKPRRAVRIAQAADVNLG